MLPAEDVCFFTLFASFSDLSLIGVSRAEDSFAVVHFEWHFHGAFSIGC